MRQRNVAVQLVELPEWLHGRLIYLRQYNILYMEDLHPYRAPMVTASGIFLGFMLNFTSNWIRDAFSTHIFRDFVMTVGIVTSLATLLTVLFRILRMQRRVDTEKFYRRTLLLFMIGVSVPFFAFLIVIVQKIVITFF